MEGFVAMTPREPSEDENRPPPPKESIGRLPKGERPASLPRGKGELPRGKADMCRVGSIWVSE
jgi:hypothetical protein